MDESTHVAGLAIQFVFARCDFSKRIQNNLLFVNVWSYILQESVYLIVMTMI